MGSLIKLLREALKRLTKKPPVRKPTPAKKPTCKKGCSPSNPYASRTTAQNQKSKCSYEELRDEHKEKLADYKKDPMKYDNQGRLRDAPSEAIRQRIIRNRIGEL